MSWKTSLTFTTERSDYVAIENAECVFFYVTPVDQCQCRLSLQETASEIDTCLDLCNEMHSIRGGKYGGALPTDPFKVKNVIIT